MSNHVLLSTVVIVLLPALARAQTVPTNWWSNQTAVLNVFNDIANSFESPRLDNATSGFIEGVVALPIGGPYHVSVLVEADEAENRNPGDFVDVFINGLFLGRALNTPAVAIIEFDAVVNDPAFSYRFEFTSGNALFHLHQAILPSEIIVPEASTLALALVGLLAHRRRSV